ncbi:uncharacterized protein NESG_01853 [Nematocida ausubeli]|uniref:Uncharacterized protein n=1 Tax=Nematocida ausubeli (strain ATCC PRA-371 / ERTm2) TaxID=1913371 RepID=A0A086J147_NEMA1|nr:uncharacterized protein NESG_01853 [Nematocida ausubeli]KFG25865.1 hypothetical protein NESG_01853 [Nematocida ausubeli]
MKKQRKCSYMQCNSFRESAVKYAHCKKTLSMLLLMLISFGAASQSIFSPSKYDWLITAGTESFKVTKEMTLEELNNLMDQNVAIQLTSKNMSKEKSLELQYSAEIEAALCKWLFRVDEVVITNLQAISDGAINALPYLKGLKSIQIRIDEKDKSTLNARLSCISKCKELKCIVLDVPNLKITEKIEWVAPNLSTLFFRNLSFTGEIHLHQMSSIERITIFAEKLNAFTIDYASLKKVSQKVHAEIHTNHMGNIPFAAIANKYFFLRILSLNKNQFAAKQYTTITDKKGIMLGYDAYIHRIISYLFLQRKQKIYCCHKKPLSDLYTLMKHVTHAHKTNSFSLFTQNKEKDTHEIVIPRMNDAISSMVILSQAEKEEIAEFLQQAIILELWVLVNGISINIECPLNYPLSAEKWILYLPILHKLSFMYQSEPANIPRCFYKLYTLDSLIVRDSSLKNLFEILVSMPGLRTVVVENCLFKYASSHMMHKYIKYSRVFDQKKSIKISGNIDEDELKSLRVKITIFCFVLIVFLIALYAMSHIYYKSKMEIPQRERQRYRSLPDLRQTKNRNLR